MDKRRCKASLHVIKIFIMKYVNLISIGLVIQFLASCKIVGGIFKVGFYAGAVVVIVAIVLIAVAISKSKSRK